MTYECSRCGEEMLQIMIIRVKYNHDVCKRCQDDIEEFATTKIERSYEADNRDLAVERDTF